MGEDLERAIEKAKERLDRANAELTTAQNHYDSLNEHHEKGKSWTTHSDEQLKADFNERNQRVKNAHAEKAMAEGRYNDLERELRAEREKKRELAAENARKIALENEKKRKEGLEKKLQSDQEKSLEFKP
jgi:hypothetical protein